MKRSPSTRIVEWFPHSIPNWFRGMQIYGKFIPLKFFGRERPNLFPLSGIPYYGFDCGNKIPKVARLESTRHESRLKATSTRSSIFTLIFMPGKLWRYFQSNSVCLHGRVYVCIVFKTTYKKMSVKRFLMIWSILSGQKRNPTVISQRKTPKWRKLVKGQKTRINCDYIKHKLINEINY